MPKAGDTIISTVRTYLGSVLFLPEPTGYIVSTGFAVISPGPGLEPRYLALVLQSDVFIDEVVARSVGVSYPAIAPDDLGDIAIGVPPLGIQRAIADFLDTETTLIDQLVARRRHAINLIEERFASQRSRTVLRDLDPVSGKGAVPDGWDVAALGVVIQLHRGFDLPTDEREGGEIPVISSGGITGLHSRAMCEGPGVVTGRTGTVGSVTYIEGPYWPHNTALYVSQFRGNYARWVYHLLASLPLEIDSAKSAVTGINRNVIAMLRAPQPPLAEQRVIAAQLDRALEACESTRTALRRQIELFTERRHALITAAVTGKIPIPGVA